MMTVVITDRHTLPALLDTMESPILISDSRQKADKHNNVIVAAARRGIEVRPATLPVGDYMLATPSGYASDVTFDTKRGIQEIQQNTFIDCDRVAREMERASELGLVLVFLVELSSEEQTLCDVCPRAASCPHAGYCEQHEVYADFSDKLSSLRAFASFVRKGGATAIACWTTETGDAILDLFTDVKTNRVAAI